MPLSPIRIEFLSPGEVDDAIVDRMWALAQESLSVERDWIATQARSCDYLLLYRHVKSGRIVGTTALTLLDLEHAGTPVRALYTSAVLIEGAWRSRNLLQQAGMASVLRFGRGRRRLYWMCECDNFRVYLTATRHFVEAWPRHGREPPAFERELMPRLCREVFGDEWDGARGVCAAISDRVLHGEYSAIPAELLARDVDAAFFARVNPGYRAGDGLPVLVRLSPLNIATMMGRAAVHAFRRRWRGRNELPRAVDRARELESVRPPRFRPAGRAGSSVPVPPAA